MTTNKPACLKLSKINKNVQIVRSTKRSLSSMSQESAEAILKVLTKNYIEAGITIVNNMEDLESLVAKKPDLLFLGLHYIFDDHDNKTKIWLSKYLDEHNIAYTGSSHDAHNLELNKHRAKQAIIDAGLKTSPFVVINHSDELACALSKLTFPMFIKPTNKGGGAGIDVKSVVQNTDDLREKVSSLSDNNWTQSLAEQLLTGREFSVAIIRENDRLLAMPIELVASPDENGMRILSRDVKSSNNEQVLAVDDKRIHEIVTELAIKSFEALGARDYGRIDIRMDEKGTPHFLEANLIPSLIENYGSFPKACLLNNNLSHETIVLHILNMASNRA